MTSLIFSRPVTNIINLSNPRPKPENDAGKKVLTEKVRERKVNGRKFIERNYRGRSYRGKSFGEKNQREKIREKVEK